MQINRTQQQQLNMQSSVGEGNEIYKTNVSLHGQLLIQFSLLLKTIHHSQSLQITAEELTGNNDYVELSFSARKLDDKVGRPPVYMFMKNIK